MNECKRNGFWTRQSLATWVTIFLLVCTVAGSITVNNYRICQLEQRLDQQVQTVYVTQDKLETKIDFAVVDTISMKSDIAWMKASLSRIEDKLDNMEK